MNKAIYIAYLTGAQGNSIALIYIDGSLLAGVDVGGIKYEGSLHENENGSLEGLIKFVLSKGQNLITGFSSPNDQEDIRVLLKLPRNFDDGQIVKIETPIGVINAKFEKLKDLP